MGLARPNASEEVPKWEQQQMFLDQHLNATVNSALPAQPLRSCLHE
jgi:hypothetical protein